MQLQSLPAASTAEPLQFLDRPLSWSISSAFPLGVASLFVFLLHGYHPYAQDASIYIAGVERQINGSLFQMDAAFVDGHTHFSIFSYLMATLVRYLHIPLDLLLLLTYLLTIAAFMSAAYLLACRLFEFESARWSATLLSACCFTLPAAGTSLLLMDPYVTARSISTPLSLFAILGCFDRSLNRAVLFSALALVFHPLMGIYLVFFLSVFTLLDQRHWRAAISVCVAVFVLCLLITFIGLRVPITAAYREVALSRDYYFLSRWRWYEVIGLVAPLTLMVAGILRLRLASLSGRVCFACVLVGSTACFVSVLLVHRSHPDLLMRLQVLRSFHTIYILGVILLGGFLGSQVWVWKRWITVTLFLLAGVAMLEGSVQSYPSSPHIAWPGSAPRNPWEKAFLWIRANAPPDAVFAADPHSFNQAGQDSIGFRVVAERSILTDVKDEGVASLFPPLAKEWRQRRDAQLGLDLLDDRTRVSHLHAYGVNWLLLSAQAQTHLPCPYRNSTVAVCRMNP